MLAVVGLMAVLALAGALADPQDTSTSPTGPSANNTAATTFTTIGPATTDAPTTIPTTTNQATTIPATTIPTTTIPATAPPTTEPPPPTLAPGAIVATVTRVVDGDTVDVDTGDRIRFIGIDTPERGECGYTQSTANMRAMVEGKVVVLTPGAVDDVDRYGRLLRYVDVDGIDSGLAQIAAGLAIARYDSRDGYGRHPREDIYVATDEATPAFTCG